MPEYSERDMPVEDTYPPEYLQEADAILNGLMQNGAQSAPAAQPAQQAIPSGRGFAYIRSVDPETGEERTTLGISPRSTLPEFPIPRPRRDPMEEMRKTINAIQFQKANDAYKAALSFQAARAYRQDLDAGRSQAEALARWGHLLPGGQSGAAAMINATRPVPSPAVTNIGGRDILQSGRFGERATLLPAPIPTGPVPTQPLIGTDNKPIPGVRVARGQSGALHIVKEVTEEPKASPSLNFQVLKTAIDATQKDLGQYGKEDPEYGPLKTKLDGLKQDLEAMLPKKATVPAQSGIPKPTSRSEYDALPKGARYLDPNGVQRVKG